MSLVNLGAFITIEDPDGIPYSNRSTYDNRAIIFVKFVVKIQRPILT